MLQRMSSAEKVRFSYIQADFLQRRLGTNIISFPYLNMPVSEYTEFIDNHYRTNANISTIFTLDMGMERRYLEAILNHIIQKGHPLIINLIYKEWQKTIPQYDLVNHYFDNERTAFFLCQIEREEPESHTSNLHSVTLGGGSSFAYAS
jgi:hypothetical protein